MKCCQVFRSLFLLFGAVQGASRFVAISEHTAREKKPSPITKIVTLLSELKQHVTDDGAAEQKGYDKYACWCEDTMAEKAANIETAKASILELQASITKNKAEVAAHQASITNLEKAIKENFESQNDASELRAKENAEFEKSKTESESAIGALKAAITVLDGAGAKKVGFLGTLQEAQMLGVLAGVKKVLKSSVTTRSLSIDDINVVDHFVQKPEEVVGNRLSGFSAAQIANNPFGDYAPQSTRIQGILKELQATFETDLKTATEEEQAAVKEFESLMATKTMEAKTLQKTLDVAEFSAASKATQLAQDKVARDDTSAQLKADEVFFAETKSACKGKALEWSERSRIRIEELQGITQAISVLSSPEATRIFTDSSAKFFLQIRSEGDGDPGQKAYAALKKLAKRFPNLALALKNSAAVKTGGHFDKVITMIDEMMKVLREEEAEDITHRDLCQSKQNANSNELADLAHDISKTEQGIGRMETSIGQLTKQIEGLTTEINKTKTDLATLLRSRNEEYGNFKTALKDDTDAVALVQQAIEYLTQMYTNNKLKLGFVQHQNYTNDPDKAPEPWSAEYTGRSSEGGGIVSILSMVKEDIEKEISTARKDDAAAEAAYEKMRSDLQASLDAQQALKVAKEKARSMLEGQKQDASDFKDSKDNDLLDEKGVQSALTLDCAWVSQHFEARRVKRKMEMQGLVEAKAFLSGIDAGEPVIAPVAA